MTTTRQNKISRLIQKELSELFQRDSYHYENALISVTVVRISPDLGNARVYLSIFAPGKKRDDIFDKVVEENREIRKKLAERVKDQLRAVPTLDFHIDDSLDYFENIDKLLKK